MTPTPLHMGSQARTMLTSHLEAQQALLGLGACGIEVSCLSVVYLIVLVCAEIDGIMMLAVGVEEVQDEGHMRTSFQTKPLTLAWSCLTCC